MKTAGKVFLWTSIACIVLWMVPWLYRVITLKQYQSPFTLYSCIVHDFTAIDHSDSRTLTFIDRYGNKYGEEVQPLFYHSLLSQHGTLPDTIEGRKVTEAEIDRAQLIMTMRPKDVNKTIPPVCLLMESVPLRLELQDPEDAFVTRKDGLYIYEMATNTLNKEKSAKFNAALDSVGFHHPAVLRSGTPSHRKEYDEGWLLTDSEGKLFQLKQVDGLPYVRYFPEADTIGVKHVFITEFQNRVTLGYLVGQNGKLYMLRSSGEVVPTEVSYNPAKENLLLVGDLFYYTVKVSDDTIEHFYALSADDFSLVDTYDRPYDFEDEVNLCEYIFPFRIHFTSGDDGWVKPRIEDFSWIGLAVDAVLAALIFFIIRRRRNTKK